MDSLKEKQIVELIKNRLDLNYVQVSFLTGVPLTTVHKVAKDNGCQRKRGGGAKKPLVQTQGV